MNKSRWLPIILWGATVLVFAWVGLGRTPIGSDLTVFMPGGATPDERLLVESLRSSPASRQIMIAIEGESEATRARASKELAERLRRSGLFAWVENGSRSLDSGEFQQMFKYRYLLSPTTTGERFTQDNLRISLRRSLARLSSPFAPLQKRLLPADPTGELNSILDSWRTARQPAKVFGVWFSPDRGHALLLSETHASGLDLDAQEHTVDTIRRHFETLRGQTRLRLILGGPGVYGVQSRNIIRSEAAFFSIAASAAVVVVLLVFYRSLVLLLLSAVPLVSAILAGIAAVSLWFGSIHGITLAFGVTLLGVVIDYPLHVFSHLVPQRPFRSSFRRIWPTLRLSAVTTCIGYLALTATSFGGLQQIGVFAVSGILMALATTHWVIPALLPAAWSSRRDTAASPWILPHLLSSRPAAIGVAVSAAVALLAVGVTIGTPWEDDLSALSPLPQHIVAQDRRLHAEIGAPEVNHLALITAPDAESALQHSEALAERLEALVAQGLIAGFDTASRYLPSAQTQRSRQQQLPEAAVLQRNLAAAASNLPFSPGLFQPFLQAVESSRKLAPLRPADLAGTPLGTRVGSMLIQRGGQWTAAIPLSGVRDTRALKAWFAANAAPNTRYLNVRSETFTLIARFRDEAAVLVLWGVLLMTLVLWMGLRSWRAVLRVVFPVAVAIVVELALLLGLGTRLSLFHLVSLLLVLGIGMDYTLFFSQRGLTLNERKRTLHALSACCISTVVMFGMLALSAIPVLKAIGATAALGVGISFFMAMLFSPRAGVSRPER